MNDEWGGLMPTFLAQHNNAAHYGRHYCAVRGSLSEQDLPSEVENGAGEDTKEDGTERRNRKA